jgi:hypothetical protein
VYVAPLQIKGLREKKITPNVRWEIPVKSHQLESERGMDHVGQQLRVVDLGYGTLVFILNGRLLSNLHFHLYTFNCVKKVFELEF